MGWGKGFCEGWMRLHDRRSLLAAFILAAAYAGLLAMGLLQLAAWAGIAPVPLLPEPLPVFMTISGSFLLWRAFVRMIFVQRDYGWRQALLSAPRMLFANVIAMMAARRAVILYIRLWSGGTLRWDKTRHKFPDLASIGAAT